LIKISRHSMLSAWAVFLTLTQKIVLIIFF